MSSIVNCSMQGLAKALALVVGAMIATPVNAALVASFESGLEGWLASAAGTTATHSTFGATEGSNSFLIDNLPSGGRQYPARMPQFGPATAGFTAIYPIFDAAGALQAAGYNPRLEFDMTFDFSNVTAHGFFQISPLFNSSTYNGTSPAIGGFKQYGTGAFVTGNTNSPLGLGAASVADGATMTSIGSNQYHFSIPLGVGKSLSFGPGSTFHTLCFQTNGGWQGTVDIGLDNVRLTLVPEPATAAMAGLALVGLATARRRRATV